MRIPDASENALQELHIPEALAPRLAEVAGVPRVPATLAELTHDWGRGLRDNWRQLLLTDKPTAHEVRFDEFTFHVNCALDALLLPFLAQRSATVFTADPISGERISLTVDPDGDQDASHPQAVLSLGVSGVGGNVHECACPHINLFASTTTFGTWRDENASVASMGVDLPAAVAFASALGGGGDPIKLS